MNIYALTRTILLVLFAVGTNTVAISASHACTNVNAQKAAFVRAEQQKKMRLVVGNYYVDSIEQRTIGKGKNAVKVSVYKGRIKSQDGKVYHVEHVDDGSIVLCATSTRPLQNAAGDFYLSAKKKKGNNCYTLLDWDGTYVPNPKDAKSQ